MVLISFQAFVTLTLPEPIGSACIPMEKLPTCRGTQGACTCYCRTGLEGTRWIIIKSTIFTFRMNLQEESGEHVLSMVDTIGTTGDIIMDATGKRRLLKLADMLEADAKNKKRIKFDLDFVGEPSSGEERMAHWVGKIKWKPEVSCGTTACAMGLASISGEFKKAGLSYSVAGDGYLWNTVHGRKMPLRRSCCEDFSDHGK